MTRFARISDLLHTPLSNPEPPVTITKLMDDYHVVVGERVEFEIEVSEEGAHVMWSVKNGLILLQQLNYQKRNKTINVCMILQ